MNQQSVSDIERGRKGIPMEILVKLGNMGIDLNWLITGKGKMLGEKGGNMDENNGTEDLKQLKDDVTSLKNELRILKIILNKNKIS